MLFRKVQNKTPARLIPVVVGLVVATGLCGLLLAGCGGGGGGHADGDSDDDNPSQATCTTPPAANGSVTISGTVTYDRVPAVSSSGGVELNYDETASLPARGMVVEALACNLSIISSTVTSATGQYSLQVGGEVPVRIRVKAQLLSSSGATWNVNVVNNTANDAQYVLDGAMVTTTTANEVRNLHAASGWGGTRYSSTRAAAPFAILDSIYGGMQKIAAVDAAVGFPQLTVHWSADNQQSDTESDVDEGLLPASYFDFRDGDIYLLGKENQDTDEYDDHVILHEWGHYIEFNFGRSDNLGGAHSDASHVDARVAQSEGFGNAWSAIMTDSAIYVDTDGSRQSNGFDFNIEGDNIVGFPGWFKEFSVQEIIYDLYDTNDDGSDQLALGLGPIWQTLVTALPNTPAFVTVFAFIDGLKAISPASVAEIDAITTAHNIQPINDAYGSTEDNWGGLDTLNNIWSAGTGFPGVEGTANVYETLVLNAAQTVCTTGFWGAYNGLAVTRYFTFNVATSRNYRFSVSANFNSSGATPAIAIWKNGTLIVEDHAINPVTQSLATGDYVVEVFDERNIDGEPLDGNGNPVDTGIDVCFAVTVTAP
jgi:hypothetical protein